MADEGKKLKKKILFLCTGNSCRSQMAEAWANTLKFGEVEAWSAGVERKPVDPLAIKAMAEAGVDISRAVSKTVDELPDMGFDFVITLCSHAQETCPYFPARTRVVHRGFDDPPLLARDAANEEEAFAHYQRVRDEIRDYVLTLPESLIARMDEKD